MIDRLLADVVVVAHLTYLAFIVVGGYLAWRWRWLVPFHVAALVVGLVSITVGFECPLTDVENWFRERSGQTRYTEGFVDHYLTGRLFPHGHDALVQALVAAAVIGAYVGLAVRSRHSVRPRGSTSG